VLYHFETVLAAVGGLLLGIGIGLAISYRRERNGARELFRMFSKLRSDVIPTLERQARLLGIARTADDSSRDALETAIEISAAIDRRASVDGGLAYSDTLEVSRSRVLNDPASASLEKKETNP
jgi:hypothetical protein